MAESVAQVVSWGEEEIVGTVPNSEWVRPTGRLDRLQSFHRANGVVTDEDIRCLASGRDQHLELLQFPEGFHAVRIIDTKTGNPLEGEGPDTREYGGLASCSCGHHKDEATTRDAFSGTPLPLVEGLVLARLSNWFREGLRTQLRLPLQSEPGDPRYTQVRYAWNMSDTEVNINPSGKQFEVKGHGVIENLGEGVDTVLHVWENYKCLPPQSTNSGAAIHLSRGHLSSNLSVRFDEEGNMNSMYLCEPHILEDLGIDTRPELDRETYEGKAAYVKDPLEQRAIINGVARALGFDEWTRINLRQTAAKLYSAIRHPAVDPSSAIVLL